jgi:hypothetical protein
LNRKSPGHEFKSNSCIFFFQKIALWTENHSDMNLIHTLWTENHQNTYIDNEYKPRFAIGIQNFKWPRGPKIQSPLETRN